MTRSRPCQLQRERKEEGEREMGGEGRGVKGRGRRQSSGGALLEIGG